MRNAAAETEELELLEWLDPARPRLEGLEAARRFGSVLHDETGATRSYFSLFPAAYKITQQLELELPGYAERAQIRVALGHKIRYEVLPIYSPRWLERVPSRLCLARRSGCYGIPLATGKPIVYWDLKAGLSRLCPDDAREEAMRLRRRVQPKLEELQKAGHQLTYAVFTLPNFQPGRLRDGMAAIFKRFKAVMRAKNADGEPLFPQVKGALCVLEAPLGRARDWNVHLNVILATRGFFDWKALRAQWHWNVELRKLTNAPGAIGAALAELIKYAVAAAVTKSEAHARDGRSPAPPMLAWSPPELAEWLKAMHGFRRTRSYGELYGLADPPLTDLGPIAWLGTVHLVGGRYQHRLVLLDSIPEDKSALDEGPQDPRTSWQRFRHRLKLDHLAPVPELSVTVNDIYDAIEHHPLMQDTSRRS